MRATTRNSPLPTALLLLALGHLLPACARTDGPEIRTTSMHADRDGDRPASGARGRDDGSRAGDRWARHLAKLQQKIPAGARFTVVVERPFVVIGDEPPEIVRQRAEQTVRWAVQHLKKAYFDQDPAQIIDIWLLRDKQSYRKHAREIFRDDPDTPFGYYSAVDRALIMNIATGGGTLCHEIVHAFMDSNFPACPAWFNEGLASLYEQCGTRDGRIVGFTNWRLAGLKKAIRADEVSSFRRLTATDRHAFYEEDRGTNYAQARYLCYYLQGKRLLRKFYRAFRTRAADDPSGYRTLVEVLGEPDMAAFQVRWQQWALGLRYP